ncbi:MAG: VWA domain-containing protein [Fimbriimonadia bacterium]|nr:VWA domain-containing protein [Fimbriimonadia bacterium]
MHTTTYENPYVIVTVTAHSDGLLKLLMVRMVAAQTESKERQPLEIALVLDRSGSMKGDKLKNVLESSARLVRALSPHDRVAVVAYDHEVDVITPLQAPSDRLAQRIEYVTSRGNTNLYSGWVTGAKLLNAGGRVLLLSDGLANSGTFTDADSLGQHAAFTLKRYQKTTSTIGVGHDFDEALMATMAREGGGRHYFAHDVDEIMNAFSQEQLSMDSVFLENAELVYQGQTHTIGSFWDGEIKTKVFPILDLSGELRLQFRVVETGETISHRLVLPNSFGHSDEATLELLIQRVSILEMRMITLKDSGSANQLYSEARNVMMHILNHPLADSSVAQAVISGLKGTMERLDNLKRTYNEREAQYQRQRSMQKEFNLRNRGQSYSSFRDEEDRMYALSVEFINSQGAKDEQGNFRLDTDALRLAPIERWRTWRAVPVRSDYTGVAIVTENPKDGFRVREISQELGTRVRSIMHFASPEEIDQLLDELEQRV